MKYVTWCIHVHVNVVVFTCTCYKKGQVKERLTGIKKILTCISKVSKVVYCGPAKVGTHVGAATKVSVPAQGDVHQGWPEISCILSGQAAKL